MSTSQFRFMPKLSTGLLILESFESANFITDQLWNVLNGNPVQGLINPYDGIYSLPIDSSFPLLQIDGGATAPQVFNVRLWDDPTNTTGAASYVFVSATAGTPGATNCIGIGVDNAVSTANYVIYKNGIKSDSGVPRQAGYIFLNITTDVGGDYCYIGGSKLSYGTSIAGRYLTLGTLATTGNVPFNYFDLVQIYQQLAIQVYGLQPGQWIWLLDFDNSTTTSVAPIYTYHNLKAQVEVPVIGPASLIANLGMQSPLNGFFVVTDEEYIINYISPVSQVTIGDIWTFDMVDFGRRATMIDVLKSVTRTDKESNSGVNEAVFFNARENWTFTMTDITEAQRTALDRWWSFAQQANEYAVAVNSDKASFFFLAAATAPMATSFLIETANNEIPVIPNIAPGDVLILKNQNNLNFEQITVASVEQVNIHGFGFDATQITTKDPIHNIYQAFDIVQSTLYTPFAIASDKQLNVKLTNAKLKRWDLTHKFKEALF